MKTILFDNDSGQYYAYDEATNIKTFLRSNPMVETGDKKTRLTWRRADGAVCPRVEKGTEIYYIAGEFTRKVYGKLADYEDAEEQGLLVWFPCKVGDTVYEIDLPEYGVIVCEVLHFTYGRSDITGELTWCVAVEVIEGHGLGSCYTFAPDDFGKIVFLTRGKVEAALKEAKD